MLENKYVTIKILKDNSYGKKGDIITVLEREAQLYLFPQNRAILITENVNVNNPSQEHIKIPNYYELYATNIVEQDMMHNGLTSLFICDSQKNQWFDLYYYGRVFLYDNEKYLVETENAPLKIIAKSPVTGEEILIFDGAVHGYDNMFCDEYSKEQIENRLLKKHNLPLSKLKIVVGYSIEYEDEKDDFEVDDNGNVILLNQPNTNWDMVIRNGIDWFILYAIDKNNQMTEVANIELA